MPTEHPWAPNLLQPPEVSGPLRTMLLLRFRAQGNPAVSLLLVPCAPWVLYAAALDLAVWRLNA